MRKPHAAKPPNHPIVRGAPDPPALPHHRNGGSRPPGAMGKHSRGKAAKFLLPLRVFFLNHPQCGGFVCRMEYQGFGGKLHHEVPAWAGPGSRFHIRIRCAADYPVPLTTPSLAAEILKSARFYEARHIWHVTVFLLMPDHIHAILSFAPDRQMRRVVGDWKRYLARTRGITWQENFFDHRLRDDSQSSMKYDYILQNPVAAGLCEAGRDWPWKIA